MGTMCDKMDDQDYSKIIRVREESGKQLVSARELYIGLGYDLSHYTRWVKKNIIDNSFCEEGIDWCSFAINGEPDNETYNPNPTKDYALSIDLAKKLAMMARTEIGDRIRDYFIQCEKKLQSMIKVLPQDFPSALRALADAEEEKQKALEAVKQKELEVKERDKYIRSNHHKVNFFDHCVNDDEKLYDMLEASKILMNGRKGGRNTLMNDLRCIKILMWNNLPYEQFIQSGYLKVKVVKMVDKYNVEHFSKSTLVTNKGLGYLKKKLDEYYESIAV